MLIERIDIRNYRSCTDTALSLHPHLSVLIGPNGSGKTNILTAALLLKRLTQSDERRRMHRDATQTAESKLKVRFDVDGKTAILTSSVNTFTNERNDDVVVSSNQSWYLKDFTGSARRINAPLWVIPDLIEAGPQLKDYSKQMSRYWRRRDILIDIEAAVESRILPVLSTIAQHLSGIRYYSASQFTNPKKCPVSFEIESRGRMSRAFTQSGHSKFLFDLYQAQNNQAAEYQEFFSIVGPDGIGLIDDIEFQDILTSSIDYSVRSGGKVRKKKVEKKLIIPKFTIGRDTLSPNQLSEGTFKTITLLFYLMTETSNILLIEEPEVCVHHGLLCSIMELIKTYSREKQIVVSTHSDLVVDQVSPENVFCISRDPKVGTKAKHVTASMSRKDLSALKTYLETQGNLGEYWRHGALEV